MKRRRTARRAQKPRRSTLAHHQARLYSLQDLQGAFVHPEDLDPRHPIHLRRQHREITSALRQLRHELKRSPSFRAETERCMFARPVVSQNGPIRLYARRAETEDLVTFEQQPVEYLNSFINGKFSPADLA